MAKVNRYEDMNNLQLDVVKEIGSIGAGNAATSLSQVIGKEIRMTVPSVSILGYNEAVHNLGDPEEVVAGVLVQMSGEINGIMLYLLKLDFVNAMLESVFSRRLDDFSEMTEIENSALVEIGNIMISSYVNAMSKLVNLSVNLSVPDIAVNMLGGILSVPMAALGYESDKLMTINGRFICDNQEMYSNLLMLPDVKSMNTLFEKLGVSQ